MPAALGRPFAFFFALAASAAASAGPADLDPRFDDDGRRAGDYAPVSVPRFLVLRTLGDNGIGPAALLERRVGTEAHLFLVRYNDDGTERAGAIDLGLHAAEVTAAHALPDGRVYTAIQYPEEFGKRVQLSRRGASGALDTTFGGDGHVEFGLPDRDLLASAIAVDAAGNVAIAGLAEPVGQSSTPAGTFVGQVDAGGARRLAFDGDGIVFQDLVVGERDFPEAVALNPNGSVLVCHSGEFVGQSDALLTRLRASGALDTGYASSGTLYFDSTLPGNPDRHDYCAGLELQPGSGESYIAVRSIGAGSPIGAVRLIHVDSGGDESPSFDTVSGDHPVATLTFDRVGRALLVAAVGRGQPDAAVKVVRYTAAGAPDAGFGVGGAASYPLPLPPEIGPGMANPLNVLARVDPRGRLLVGGGVGDDSVFGSAWFALRISGDAILVDGFE